VVLFGARGELVEIHAAQPRVGMSESTQSSPQRISLRDTEPKDAERQSLERLKGSLKRGALLPTRPIIPCSTFRSSATSADKAATASPKGWPACWLRRNSSSAIAKFEPAR
jgi:hypothetical protein